MLLCRRTFLKSLAAIPAIPLLPANSAVASGYAKWSTKKQQFEVSHVCEWSVKAGSGVRVGDMIYLDVITGRVYQDSSGNQRTYIGTAVESAQVCNPVHVTTTQ